VFTFHFINQLQQAWFIFGEYFDEDLLCMYDESTLKVKQKSYLMRIQRKVDCTVHKVCRSQIEDKNCRRVPIAMQTKPKK
jgi:hypothetical protein